MDALDISKPLHPTIDYETRYWADKLGVPVEQVMPLVSGRRVQRAEASGPKIELTGEPVNRGVPALRMA